jgi:hypothetical protein
VDEVDSGHSTNIKLPNANVLCEQRGNPQKKDEFSGRGPEGAERLIPGPWVERNSKSLVQQTVRK